MNKNVTTLVIVAIGLASLWMLTRTDIFQFEYFENPNANAGSMY
tara:strand:+ start:768 stop:899 length:132 start_codon:yes stop_codon:yes gene_type:complete